MEGKIVVVKKPEVKPIGPRNLEELKPYRVVEIKEGFTEAAVGDIVIRFPSGSGGIFVLNCTRQKMFFDRSQSDTGWNSSFQCLRAFDIERITFCFDGEDRPHA